MKRTIDGPLRGMVIGITAHRRAEDLIAAFERRGATTMHAPVLTVSSAGPDGELVAATREVVAARPDIVVVTTAYGMRKWIECADAAGLLDELVATLGAARMMIRGPKARGAVRAAGIDDSVAVQCDLTADIVDRLVGHGVSGLTIVLQAHGYTDAAQIERLRTAGARVLVVEPYRWEPEDDHAAADRLVEAVCARRIEALTFTSAPAVDALLGRVRQTGRLEAFLTALSPDAVLAAAVGPVTAEPLLRAGVQVIVPERHRLGALVREVETQLVAHRILSVATPAGILHLRGQGAMLDDHVLSLPPSSQAILRALAEVPGRTVGRAELLAQLPYGTTDHALDVAISRLRKAFPDGSVVRTIPRRGYLLATAP
ncbi:uroporphyrinogen-III synthase [Raineyella antarctica]|uniref:Uroporphyrinogen-III synthase n=1 Tax=Raineyella antarctica TaxID=1577474 RepID=A0A1G6GFT0_9ACTN|nr:uroporphyrinogen-III synthase [Raineyella antarctica]SDB80851.1 uroporphyrinogen-III synthase [Raineyella antarctica]